MGLLTFSLNVTLDGCVDHQEGIADRRARTPVDQQPPHRRRSARGRAEAEGRDPGRGAPASGELATELDRLDLIDEYELLIHPRIAGHGPTLYQGGLPATRQLELLSAKPLRNGAVAMHYRRAR